jgi:hypothetical protein
MKLKPCPFCGRKGVHDGPRYVDDMNNGDENLIDSYGCPECRIWTDSARKWNRRVNAPKTFEPSLIQQRLIDALQKFADQKGITVETLLEKLLEKHSPAKCVREIVVEWLKENGYEGLYSSDAQILLEQIEQLNLVLILEEWHPGVLKDGKIVRREK